MVSHLTSADSFHLSFLRSLLPTLDLLSANVKSYDSIKLLEIEKHNLRIVSSEAPISICFDPARLLRLAEGRFMVCPFSFGLEDFCLADRCFALPPFNISQASVEAFETDTAALICELTSEARIDTLLQFICELACAPEQIMVGVIASGNEDNQYMRILERRLSSDYNIVLFRLETIESLQIFADAIAPSAIACVSIENERLLMSLITLMAYKRIPVIQLAKPETTSENLSKHLRARCHVTKPLSLHNVSFAIESRSYLAHLCENSYRHSIDSLLYNAQRLTELVTVH